MKLPTKKIKKLLKSKVSKTLFVLVGVVVLFSWFPSCGSRTLRTVVIDGHPTRDGHMKAISEHSDYIQDISFKLDETKDPTEAVVGLIYFEDGGENKKALELELVGTFGLGNDPLVAKVQDEEHVNKVSGIVGCLVKNCSGVVTIQITYLDKEGNQQTIQGKSTSGVTVVFNESEDPENANAGTREGIATLGPLIAVRLASDTFVSYWKSYLNNLKEGGKNISPNLPPDAIEVNYSGGDGNFIKLSANAPTDTFARPINMRISQEILVENEELEIPGILLNGERLVENEQHCVVWSKDKKEDGTLRISEDHRYASSLLNATLLFVGPKLKVNEKCAINIVLGQSANRQGGKLPLLDETGYRETHQNGLDVDIAYITPQSRNGLFASTVDAEGEFNVEDSYLRWQRSLIKRFYDTGMVNRFVTSPEMKAKLVKLSKDDNKLSQYRDALGRIYPDASPIYRDRMQLEIICSAGSSTPTVGVTENVGCQDTHASGMEWPVDWCDDNTCAGSEPAAEQTTNATSNQNTGTVDRSLDI